MSNKLTHEEFCRRIKKVLPGYEVLSQYLGLDKRINVRCPQKHEYTVTANTLNRGARCKKCFAASRVFFTKEYFIKQLAIKKPGYQLIGEFVHPETLVQLVCPNGHLWKSYPNRLISPSFNIFCPKCLRANRRHKTMKSHEQHLLDLQKVGSTLEPLEQYIGESKKILYRCKICLLEYKAWSGHAIRGIGCPRCNNRLKSSKAEEQVNTYIKSLGLTTLTQQKIDGLAVDILIPSLKLAIEYNGLWWHRSEKKGITFHIDRTEKMAKIGLGTIHIWEDDWQHYKEHVKHELQQAFFNPSYFSNDLCWCVNPKVLDFPRTPPRKWFVYTGPFMVDNIKIYKHCRYIKRFEHPNIKRVFEVHDCGTLKGGK